MKPQKKTPIDFTKTIYLTVGERQRLEYIGKGGNDPEYHHRVLFGSTLVFLNQFGYQRDKQKPYATNSEFSERQLAEEAAKLKAARLEADRLDALRLKAEAQATKQATAAPTLNGDIPALTASVAKLTQAMENLRADISQWRKDEVAIISDLADAFTAVKNESQSIKKALHDYVHDSAKEYRSLSNDMVAAVVLQTSELASIMNKQQELFNAIAQGTPAAASNPPAKPNATPSTPSRTLHSLGELGTLSNKTDRRH